VAINTVVSAFLFQTICGIIIKMSAHEIILFSSTFEFMVFHSINVFTVETYADIP